MVRAPRIVEVTPGRSVTQASATSAIDTPRASATFCTASMIVPGALGAAPVPGLHAPVRVVAEPGGAGRALVAAVLAGQPAAAQRAPRQQPEPGVERGRHDLPLDLAHEQAVLRLQGDRRGQAQLAGQVDGLGQLPAGEVGQPVVADLAGPDEAVERAQGLLQRRQRVEGVHLVEVDRSRPRRRSEASRARVRCRVDRPGTVGDVVHREPALGGQHHRLGHVGRPRGEPAADDRLGLAAPSRRRRCRRACRRPRRTGRAGRGTTCLVGLGAEGHGAEAEVGDGAAAGARECGNP